MRLAIVALAVVLAGGCAAPAGSTTGVPVPSPSLSTAGDADREALADADATEHLAEFMPPPDAHELPVRPTEVGALATNPGMDTSTTVDVTSWWVLSSSKALVDVVTGVAVPRGAKPGDSWGMRGPNVQTWTMSFDWPVVDQVLISRQLLVTGLRLDDKIWLRVDGETTWVPQRPKESLIPAGITSIVMMLIRPALPPYSPKPSDPITVTDAAKIDVVIALVDSAAMNPYPPRPCPYAGGGELNMSFRSASNAEVARVEATIHGCDDIYLQIGQITTILTGGTNLTDTVISALKLPWQPI
jgi:hypothetical protein